MKKKVLIIFISLISVLALCIAGCKTNLHNMGLRSLFSHLTDIVNVENENLTLTITTTQDDYTITDRYETEKTESGYKVRVRVERRNEFAFDEDGSIVIPDEDITVSEGIVEFNGDWQVVSRTGAELEISANILPMSRFKFAKAYFGDITRSDGKLNAKVNRPKDFMKNAPDCTDMQMEVRYGESALNALTVRYTSSSGANVRIVYELN